MATRKILHCVQAYGFVWLIVFCALTANAINASAQIAPLPIEPSPIVLSDTGNLDIDVGLHAVFLAEQEQALTLQNILQTDKWIPVNHALIDAARANPDTNSSPPYANGNPVWLYFKIKNNKDTPRTLILDTQRPDLRMMTIYTVNSSGDITRILEHDEHHHFAQRSIQQTDLAAELQIKPNEEIRIYMRYMRTATEPMSLKIFDHATYQSKIHDKTVWVTAFLSVMTTIVLITLLALPALGWRVALSFVFYTSVVGFWYACATGYFFSVLTPNSPIFASRAVDAFAALVFVAFLNMGRVLFRFREISRAYDNVLIFVIVINLICAVLTLATDIYENPLLAYITITAAAVSFILYICNGVIAVRAKRNGSYVILFSSIALFAAFAFYQYITIAVNAGTLAIPIGRAVLIPPVSFIEISCFALAMIQAQIGVRTQRDHALQSEFKAVQEQLRLSGALRESENSYQKARRQAEMRRERLSSVSHDILQPLTSLRTSLGDIKKMDASKAQQMQNAFDYLETLARDNLGPPASNQDESSEMQCEIFKVTAVTDNVFAMFKDEAKSKGLAFQYAPQELDVFSNPIALMRIVSNLVSNALKHTQQGSVTLACHQDGDAVEINIQNTGTFMTKAEIKTYLKPYQKGDLSSGTGLGLYQVKKACEALNHRFGINSDPNTGTTVSVHVKDFDHGAGL